MTFNSVSFIVFLAVVFGAYRMPVVWVWKKRILLVASYLFYAAWNPPFVILIWISTLADWEFAKRIHAAASASTRRHYLVASLCVNLGMLGFFKYGEFLLENFVRFAAQFGVTYQPAEFGIVLPVAISFYTFQSLSYTIDVYRGKLKPWHSLTDFALFVAFFPQLVAGPIVRATEFLYQLAEEKRPSADQVGWGLALLTIGIAQKSVLADALLAPVADTVFASAASAGFVDAWAGTLAFANQIYFDFAGYSMCAIGAAMIFGFALPDNFRFPYAAVGFSDFWNRWHMSLSRWLRDYLYVSLGGNRGPRLKTLRNLAVTMLLGGLWHGADWRFVIWGALHGAYLVAERLLGDLPIPKHLVRAPSVQFILSLITFFFVCVAWVFFRAESTQDAMLLLSRMLVGGNDSLSLGYSATITPLLVAVAVILVHWYLRDSSLEGLWRIWPGWVRAFALSLTLLAIILSTGSDRAFIYFQF